LAAAESVRRALRAAVARSSRGGGERAGEKEKETEMNQIRPGMKRALGQEGQDKKEKRLDDLVQRAWEVLGQLQEHLETAAGGKGERTKK
jgi:hypothetical protein